MQTTYFEHILGPKTKIHSQKQKTQKWTSVSSLVVNVYLRTFQSAVGVVVRGMPRSQWARISGLSVSVTLIFLSLHDRDIHAGCVYFFIICFCSTPVVNSIFAGLVSNSLLHQLESMSLVLVSWVQICWFNVLYFVCLLALEIQRISKFVIGIQTWLIAHQCQMGVSPMSKLGNILLWTYFRGNQCINHGLSSKTFMQKRMIFLFWLPLEQLMTKLLNV